AGAISVAAAGSCRTGPFASASHACFSQPPPSASSSRTLDGKAGSAAFRSTYSFPTTPQALGPCPVRTVTQRTSVSPLLSLGFNRRPVGPGAAPAFADQATAAVAAGPGGVGSGRVRSSRAGLAFGEGVDCRPRPLS